MGRAARRRYLGGMPNAQSLESDPASSSVALSDALAAAVAAAAPSVLQVPRRRGGGSATAIDADHAITSNFHAPDEAEVLVATPDGAVEARGARVVGRDPTTDLALLRVDGGGLTPARFVDVTGVRVGQLALALGRPGRSIRASLRAVGVLGPAMRTPWGGQLDAYVETDRQLPRGFAGGPLVDLRGGVIGIGTRSLVRGADLAIPGTTVARVAAALRDHGAVARGFLGVAAVPARLADGRFGALVAGVDDGSPAATAGLLVGDVVLQVGDVAVDGPRALQRALWDLAGHELDLAIQRAGAPVTVRATVGSRP